MLGSRSIAESHESDPHAARLVLCSVIQEGQNDAVHDCGDSVGSLAARVGKRLHSGQLHLRAVGDRARAVRGRPRQRTTNRLKMTARRWGFQRTVTRWTCETSIAAVLAESASRARMDDRCQPTVWPVEAKPLATV